MYSTRKSRSQNGTFNGFGLVVEYRVSENVTERISGRVVHKTVADETEAFPDDGARPADEQGVCDRKGNIPIDK